MYLFWPKNRLGNILGDFFSNSSGHPRYIHRNGMSDCFTAPHHGAVDSEMIGNKAKKFRILQIFYHKLIWWIWFR
jgi:hypothetical protein